MTGKLVEELPGSDRIYVRKGDGPEREADLRRLFAALRRHGPTATMLWVTLADASHPAGTVAWLEDGLMRGWIASLAPYDRTLHGLSVDAWLAVCRAAWALRFLGDAAAYRAPSGPSVLAPDFGGWAGSKLASASFDWSIPAPEDAKWTMRHCLTEDQTRGDVVFGCMVYQGVDADAVYCFSAWLRLPEDFAGLVPWVVMAGRPSLGSSGVDAACLGRWQRVWVSARLAADRPVAHPGLVLRGPAGTTVHTAGWRLQKGFTPHTG